MLFDGCLYIFTHKQLVVNKPDQACKVVTKYFLKKTVDKIYQVMLNLNAFNFYIEITKV